MTVASMTDSQLTELIIGAAIEVHRHHGPGLLESVYEASLERELQLRGLEVKRQVPVQLSYKGLDLGEGYRIDFVVEDRIVLELKSVKEIEDIHKAQTITYIRLASKKTGLLINFNTVLLKDGLHRLYAQPAPSP